MNKTYLVGDNITLADISMVCMLFELFKRVVDPEFRKPFKNVMRWYTTCNNQPEFVSVLGAPQLCEKTQVYVAPMPSIPEKPAENLEDAGEAVEKKPKNPLDLLPPSNFNLEDWKRVYSNSETRPDAVKYFWDNYDPAGYCMYKLDYKYNSELTRIFMTCNLVSGLFQRMDPVRKYCYGNMLIFGEDNNNFITGMFIYRGSEIPPEMKDVPDFESYDFTRVDPSDPAVREMWNSYIAWDLETNLPFNQGKTFK